MESRGCNPGFHVYRTLVRNLWNAGKLSEAHEVIKPDDREREIQPSSRKDQRIQGMLKWYILYHR
jgi:hypothetical protein